MRGPEALWSVGLLGAVLFALMIFRRYRSRTQSFADGQTFKTRLPLWVQGVERVLWWALLLLFAGGVYKGFLTLHGVFTPGRSVQGVSAVFSVVGTGAVALPIAMLAANMISWLVPPIRAANARAMDGLSVTFADVNKGLFLFGCASVPLGLLALFAATFEPWSK